MPSGFFIPTSSTPTTVFRILTVTDFVPNISSKTCHPRVLLSGVQYTGFPIKSSPKGTLFAKPSLRDRAGMTIENFSEIGLFLRYF
jgi:hypothetical protein